MGQEKVDAVVDCVGETCPIPLIQMRKAVMKAKDGDVVEIIGNHQASRDEIPMGVESLGMETLKVFDDENGNWHVIIKVKK